MKNIINRVFATTMDGRRTTGCTTISLPSSYTGQATWTPPPKMPPRQATDAPPTRVAANDNRAPLTGKAARQWPALARAKAGRLLDGEKENRLAAAVLESFAALYCETSLDADAIPSPAGALLDLSIGVADLPDGALGDDGDYAVERLLENPVTAERLIKLHDDGKLRIRADGQYETQGKRGRWRVIPVDGFRHEPRGKVPPKNPKPLTVQSSKAATPRRPVTPQLDRLIAMEEIHTIRRRLDADAWAGLVAIAVDKATARQLGERAGLTFKRAEAKGGELMARYTQAAIAAFQLPDAANDNRQKLAA